jgi:hypothetical protein
MSLTYPVATERGTSMPSTVRGNLPVESGKVAMVVAGQSLDRAMLWSAVERFGWRLLIGRGLDAVRSIESSDLAAILFDPEGVEGTWMGSIDVLKRIHPGVPLIACLAITESAHWPLLRDSGVFHAIHVPLLDREVFQSLGFAWAASSRTGIRRIAAA